MARHVCDNCGAVVGDDHQFCPECGSWVDPTDSGVEDDDAAEFEEFSLTAEPPAGEPTPPVRFPRNEVQCPSCGSPNPASNRHCEECGARLSQGPLPVAPRPAVQATAGVRAAMAIAALLAVVVIISLVFNIFGDDAPTDDTLVTATTVSTTAPPPESRELDILTVDCSVTGLAGLVCENIADDGEGEYQINWDALEEGQEVSIDLILEERSVITGVVWRNLDQDDTGLFQNYRARDIRINGGDADISFELKNEGGAQPLLFSSLGTLSVTITIDSAYLPEPVDGQVFSELAIKQIELLGYPQAEITSPPTSLTDPTETTSGG